MKQLTTFFLLLSLSLIGKGQVYRNGAFWYHQDSIPVIRLYAPTGSGSMSGSDSYVLAYNVDSLFRRLEALQHKVDSLEKATQDVLHFAPGLWNAPYIPDTARFRGFTLDSAFYRYDSTCNCWRIPTLNTQVIGTAYGMPVMGTILQNEDSILVRLVRRYTPGCRDCGVNIDSLSRILESQPPHSQSKKQ